MGKLFRSPSFWIILIGFTLSLAVFFLYPLLGRKDWTGRLLVTVLPLLLTGVAVLAVRLMSLQKAMNRRGQEERPRDKAAGERSALWQVPLRAFTESALEMLRQGGRAGKLGSKALDAHRFYLVMGRDGSGKHTLMAQSGLHFPRIHPDEADLARQSQSFPRWYMGREGIFLVTPGRYVTDPGASDEVKDFAAQLAKSGKSKAVDGILLTVSLREMLGSESQTALLAQQLRATLGHFMAQVHLDLPVYVVFTHADIIPGFQSFFENLKDLEAQQVFGATLALGGQLGTPRARFEREYRKLWESVKTRIMTRLAQATSEAGKREIFLFPNELGAAQEKLALFIENLFKDDSRRESLLFRGFFFTGNVPRPGQAKTAAPSAVTGSETLFAHPLSPRAAKQTPAFQEAPASDELKPLFTGLLFGGVLRTDGSLSRRTQFKQGNLSRRALIVSLVSLVLAVLLSVYALSGFLQVRKLLGDAADSISRAAGANFSDAYTLGSDFTAFDDLLLAIQRLKEADKGLGSWSIPPGFYDGEALELALAVHTAQADRLAREASLRHLEATLQMGAAYFTPSDRQRFYEQLRLYLILTGETGEAKKKLGPEDLSPGLTGLWAEGILARFGAENVSPRLLDRLPDHADVYAERYFKKKRIWKRPNTVLIAQVRQAMLGNPSLDGVYGSIVASIPADKDLGLSEMGIPGDGILRGEARIPGFYTKLIHAELAMEAIKAGAEEPNRKDWVLGDAVALPPEMGNSDALHKALLDRYYDSYARAWSDFMQGLRVDIPSEPGQASGKLIAYASQSQGLPAVLQRMRQETDLVKSGGMGEELLADKLKKKKVTRLALGAWESREDPKETLQRKFAYLDKLLGGASGGGILQGYLQALQALGESLGQMALADDGGASALTFSQDVFAGKAPQPLGDAFREAKSALQQAPDEARIWLQPLLERPVLQAGALIMSRAENHLETQYRNQVLSFCRDRLQGRYPFDRKSTEDAAWDDFVAFFAPEEGKLARFVKKDLGSLVRLEDGGVQIRHWNGMKPPLSSAALKMLEGGSRLSARMFRENSSKPRTYFTTLILSETRNTQNIGFAMGQERLAVKPGEGAARTRVKWPSDDPYGGAEIKVDFIGGGSDTKRFDGPWGMLRLMEASRALNARPGGFTAKWRFRVAQKYELDVKLDGETQENPHPLTHNDFFRFECATDLLQREARSFQ